MVYIAAWGLVAVLAGAIAGVVAGVKNRDYSFWMAWCFVFPPLLIWLCFLPRRQGQRPRQPTLDQIDRQDSFL